MEVALTAIQPAMMEECFGCTKELSKFQIMQIKIKQQQKLEKLISTRTKALQPLLDAVLTATLL